MFVVTSNSNARPASKRSERVRAASTFRLNVMNVSEIQPRFGYRDMIRGDGCYGKGGGKGGRDGQLAPLYVGLWYSTYNLP